MKSTLLLSLLVLFIGTSIASNYALDYDDDMEDAEYDSTALNVNNRCFPLKQSSFGRISVNWGGLRSGGTRCHAGIDIYSKDPGEVVAVEDGVVTAIFDFLKCKDGWACKKEGKCGTAGAQTVAVLVYHPSIGKTFNYGEVDKDHVKIKVGAFVQKGQVIGRAGYCDMLHFEVYTGKQVENFRWAPPPGGSSANPDKCARLYMNTKPRLLEDPRPWITTTLKDKWC